MQPLRRAKWRLFRAGDASPAGLPAWAHVALFALCMALGFWSVERYNGVVVWPANGVLVAAALLLPRRQAIAVLSICFAINVAGNVIRHDASHMVWINAALNMGEALLCAVLVRRFCGATLDLRRPVRLARFALCIAPCIVLSGLIGVSLKVAPASEFLMNWQYWFTIETLGILMTTPAMLLLARASAFRAEYDRSVSEKVGLLIALVVIATFAFAQRSAPIEFLVFVPLLVIAFRLPPHWSAVSVIVIAAISCVFSLNGYGPFTLSHMAPAHWSEPEVTPVLNVLPSLDLFLAAALAVAFGASTVLTERRRLEQRLKTRTLTAQRARKAAEAAERRITHMARHDTETGLFNRLGLERETTQMLALRGEHSVFVAALGVDRFNAIRTAIGSEQAARLIEQAARRLEIKLRPALVARLAANALGVALRAATLDDAVAQLNAARDAFTEPLVVGMSRVDIRFSIGLAIASDHDGAGGLVERAQVALDQACAAGVDFALFDAGAERAAANGLTLLSELRAGLEDGGVWLAHQPKLDLRGGGWKSVECLIRWTHSERGVMAPDTFIPLLEETGAIGVVTDWVLERALREQAMMAQAGIALSMAINISARSLGEPGFAARLAAVLEQGGASTGAVTLEITETALMAHADVAMANMEAFKAAGFRLSIDDYGAGMSSLSYLKRIPADELKIDSSFVRGLTQNKTDAMLVRSTIDLGHTLGLSVVAEGVEDAATLDLLRLFGCDYAQGYHVARPMPVARLLDVTRPQARALA
ncbi:MAG: EAL domain-containing protein [Vitreimonas sp.]